MIVVLKSIGIFDNIKTFLVQFLILPFFSVLFFFLLGNTYLTANQNSSYNTIMVTIFITAMIIIITSMTRSFITELSSKIFAQEIILNPFSGYYWINKCLVGMIVGLFSIFFNLIPFYIIFHLDIQNIRAFIISAILCVFTGIVFGVLSIAISMGTNNPFLFSNFIGSYGLLFTGIYFSTNLYPSVLKIVSRLLPFSYIADFYRSNNIVYFYWSIIIDFLYLILFVFIYKVNLKRLKK
ncbi:ABC transporter permease [Companilactobacillus metriopterae]|uniref:ABC transporter permease n=1 Tax=Companilactobacillus metriopterae TaxID=1909267 RepID=UPI00100B838B|nr:ABC transporter permease [Companilactobacillus metriopterae]